MLAGAIAAVVVISGSNVGWMQQTEVQAATDLSQVPGYTGSPYTVVNDNEPDFAKSDFTTDAFEDYSDLDSLGRCGVAYANICKELMPTEKRGRIGMVKPSGCLLFWQLQVSGHLPHKEHCQDCSQSGQSRFRHLPGHPEALSFSSWLYV